MNLIPIYLIFIPIVASMIVYLLSNRFANYLVIVSQVVITAMAAIYYKGFNGLIDAETLVLGGWDKAIGISLKNDRLSMAFVFLAIFIWWMIILYVWNKRKEDFKFLFFLIFLEGTFLGLVQTNDLFNLFIFIEISTIISTILIIYKKDGYSVRAGLYYLLFNSIGMIFYLIGLVLLYTISGTLNMDLIGERILSLGSSPGVKISFIFIIAAVGVKSAFFPVYNWLPKAHGAAPASISALLSGLLIKSGLYVFIRMNQMYRIDVLNDLFFWLGVFTAISGIAFALSQKDIKQILAFHTISQIGIILMGLSSGVGYGYYGGVIHIFNHAIFKSLLFMGAGIIINKYGLRTITDIRGVFKRLPFISIFMIIGMLSITGAPFFNGFISKSVIKYGFKDDSIKTIILYIINLGTSMSFLKLSQIYFGKGTIERIKKVDGNLSMLLLSLTCIALGIFLVPISSIYFGLDLPNINLLAISNWLTYILTLAVGFILYKKIIEKDYKLFKVLRHLNISFETTNMMLVSFIFIMIVWAGIFN